MSTALIGIGCNIGDGPQQVAEAVGALRAMQGIDDVHASGCNRSRPVGGPAGQACFTNAAAVVETTLSPQDLLDELQRLELKHGRQRTTHWGSRTLDLDVLLYDDVSLQTETLQIPHPRMTFRRFVLEPAVEVAPQMLHPICQQTVQRLLNHIDTAPNNIAIGGLDSDARHWLAAKLRCLGGSHADNSSPQAVSEPWYEQRQLEVELGIGKTKQQSTCQPVASHPKLAIWLDASASKIAKRTDTMSPDEIRSRVDEFIRSAIRGPYLRLDGENRETVWLETKAAIEAMQPLVGA